MKELDHSKREIEIATFVRLNPLFIKNLRDEIQFLQWKTRFVKSIMKRYSQHQEQNEQEKQGATKQRYN